MSDHKPNWNSILQWASPLLFALAIGFWAMWGRGIELRAEVKAAYIVNEEMEAYDIRAGWKYFSLSDGKVLISQFDGMRVEIGKLSEKMDRMLENQQRGR